MTLKKRLPAAPDDKSRIQSIQRMMGILECFSTVSRHLSLAQLAEMSGLPRPTTHRMLAAMKEIGFIEQDARSGSYSLGIRLFELGNIALANMDLLREAKPFIDRLAKLSGESSHLGVFNGFERSAGAGHAGGAHHPAHHPRAVDRRSAQAACGHLVGHRTKPL